MTNIDGQFTLDVAAGQTVVVSYLGYQTQEITISNQTSLTITLVEDSQLLDEVVVTALGLKREQKALGYAVTEIKGEDLSLTGINPVSSLQGKAAGVEISGSDGGMFGGTKILIRGSSTLSGNNQPIYVVDGVVLDNNISATGSADWDSSASDYGNELKNLNPDDFATISILKGAAATALYGSRGLNGAVVITTKGGGQYKGFGVSVTQSFGIDHVYATPDIQNTYGPGVWAGQVNYGERNPDGTYKRWDNLGQFRLNSDGNPTLVNATSTMFGPRLDGRQIESYDGTMQPYKAYKNNYRDVFQLGFTSNTNVAVQGGTDKTSYYSSVSYRRQNGTLQNNTFDRISFMLKGSHEISDRVKINASMNMANSTPRNAARNIGESFLNGVPRTYDTNYYKDKYKGDHGGMASTSYGDAYGYVPGKSIWWVLNEYDTRQKETIVRPVASVEVKIQDWLNFVADGNMNYYYSRLENKALGNGYGMEGGLYQIMQTTKEQSTLGGQFNVNKTINDFGISGFARFEYYNQMEQFSNARTEDGLIVPGQFFLDNSKGTKYMKAGVKNKKRMLSAIVSASFSWKNQLYLDITGRNDWSSALVYTNATGNYSYFYPSVSASWLLNETLQLPEWVTLAKIRGSWAQVGNDTDPYSINQGYALNSIMQGNGYIYTNEVPDVMFAPDLKPERKNAYEVGLDLRFLDSRIHLDATYYKENTKNQIMQIDVPFESGFRQQRINAGNIQNQGVEIALNTVPFLNKDWKWTLDFTYTKNENKIVDLHENVQSHIALVGEVAYGNFRVGSVAKVGGAYGLLMSDKTPARTENGDIILNWNNNNRLAYEKRGGVIEEIGKVTPDFMGTVATGLSYKDISLRVLVDASFGGHVASYSNHYGTAYGYLETSMRGRDAEHGGITWTSEFADTKGVTFHDGVIPEGVIEGGVKITQPNGNVYEVANGGESFASLYERGIVEPVHASTYHRYRNDWGAGTVNDDWFHKRKYIALREITLGYRVPRAIANKLGATGINLGLTARNLCYLYNSLPNNLNPESVRGNDSREFRERQFSPFTASYMLTIGVNF